MVTEKNICDKNINVLVVDDSTLDVALLGSFLKKLNYQYKCAYTGMLALEIIRHNKFDICLMDLNMPGLSGLQTAERIRKDISRELPIIAISISEFTDGLKVQCAEAGINDFLHKPISLNDLEDKILQYVPK